MKPQQEAVQSAAVQQNAPILTPTDEFEERKKKLQELKDLKILPYAERFERTHLVDEIKKEAGDASRATENMALRTVEEIVAKPNSKVRMAGRVMLMRPHGKLTFAHLQDLSGKMQIAFMQDFLEMEGSNGGAGKSGSQKIAPPEAYKLLRKIDVGDFIGVTGELFMTKHGELTLLVQSYQLLSKTLRPLPEKFHGIADTELKYRKRYLDMLTDRETYERFLLRTRLITEIRKFLDSHNFIEIETPILTSIPSGAAAKPFTTHHHALDIDLYLRIAPETYLKRAVVGGFERVYEFAKCFRNEGMDPSHLQEFTMLEYYGSYWNFEDNMNFTQELILNALEKMTSDKIIKTADAYQVTCKDHDGKDQVISFSKAPWPRLNFAELIKKDSGINILDFYGDADALRVETKRQKIVIEKAETMGYGNLCDALYKKVSRPSLIAPAFVIKHPVDTKPLARRNDQDPRIADTFQLLVNSWEIVNAYSELIDPVDQRERLMRQADAKAAGDEEAMPMDEDFIMAMEHGMPPMSGWGMGIDRFMALITNQDNLKDTVLFPLMRPEN